MHLRAGLLHASAILPPRLRQALENRAEAGTAVAVVRRKIGAAEEGLAVRSQKHRHGPAPAAGGRLHEQHVDAVHVRALFTIHLDRNEIAIQQPRDVRILEGLALHDVAPVAGGIAHRKEHRLVFAQRLFERLLAPRIPIHGIVGVLQQVGTLLVAQSIQESWYPFGATRQQAISEDLPCERKTSRTRSQTCSEPRS